MASSSVSPATKRRAKPYRIPRRATELVTLRLVESQKMKLRTSTGPPQKHDGRGYEGRDFASMRERTEHNSLDVWKFQRGNDSARPVDRHNFRHRAGLVYQCTRICRPSRRAGDHMNLQQRRAPQSHWIYRTLRSFLAAALSFACVTSFNVDLSSVAEAKEKKPKQDPALKGLPIKELSTDEAILHALNRLGYGPRPGDVERVRQMGLAKWIDQQLNPNSIDDKALTARLENFPTLTMSPSRLLEALPQPKQAEKQAERRAQAEQRPANSVTPPVANATESTSDQASDGSGTGLRPAREMNEAANASTDESAPSPMKATSPVDAFAA